jgi:hypothetical protein
MRHKSKAEYSISSSIIKVLFLLIITLSACTGDMPQILPRLNALTPADADITSTSVTLKGEITYLGNANIIEYGIELSQDQLFLTPTRKGFTTTPVLGVFQQEFTGLTPNTTYYFRSYAFINTAYVHSQLWPHFMTKP